LDPVAPVYKYCLISVTNILTTTCQYEALKYVSFPVQTLAKCAKMIPVMVWGTLIMQKKYRGFDYLVAFLVTLGCSVFILFPAGDDISPYNKGRENTVWGVSLMVGYLGYISVLLVSLLFGFGIGTLILVCYVHNWVLVKWLTGLMVLQAHSKTNFLKVIIWKYITRYSTQQFVPLFLVLLVRTSLCASFVSFTLILFGLWTMSYLL